MVRARPAPHRGVPVLLPPHPRKATLPEPFSFEKRDQAMFEKKEEKIKQVLEEEKKAREFHAKPILKEDAVKMPARQPQQPTKVEPFKLQIEERCEERLAKWQEGVEKELSDQRKAALFKASEPKVFILPFSMILKVNLQYFLPWLWFKLILELRYNIISF